MKIFFPTSLCGVLVFDSVPIPPPPAHPRPPRPPLHKPSFTPSVRHHLSHLSHTIFVRHSLSHTTLSHAIFDAHLSHHLSHTIFHTPSFRYHFVTHHLSHTALSHAIFHIPLGDIDVSFAWQAWHLVTLTFHLCGRHGTW